MQKLKIDNRFFAFMDKIGDLVILNFLWLICCLPVITIGASAAAMCAVAMKMAAGEDPVIARTFFKVFKENFKQSTGTFLLFLISGALLLIDFLAAPTFQNILGSLLMIGSVAFGIIWFWALLYAPFVQLTFRTSITETLKKSVMLSFAHLPITLAVSIMVLLPAAATIVVPEAALYLLPLFFVLGSSCIAMGAAWLLNKVLAKYRPENYEKGPEANDL